MAGLLHIGGGSGFGAETASLFASHCCNVIVADLNLAGAEKVASENPDKMEAVKMNVASKSEWESILKHVIDKWGHLDIIVNNAGVSHKNKVFIVPHVWTINVRANVEIASPGSQRRRFRSLFQHQRQVDISFYRSNGSVIH
jgi:NADP-dependent 3-hydroxy acid dehydrogenase YdfG